jgi:uncharacterized protein
MPNRVRNNNGSGKGRDSNGSHSGSHGTSPVTSPSTSGELVSSKPASPTSPTSSGLSLPPVAALSASQAQQVQFIATASALVSRIESFSGRGFSTFGGNRDLYTTLGYSQTTDINGHRERYKRGGLAKRVVDFYPREIWAGGFTIYDDEDPEIETEFQLAYESIIKRIQIVRQLKRADKLARLGRYSVLLLGVADSRSLSEEIGRLSSPDNVIYLTPYAEDRAQVIELVKDSPSNPRYGQPLYYKIKQSADGISQSSGLHIPDAKVHWSRIIHITTDPLEDDLYSIPQLDPSWNDFDNLYKVVGGGSEASWNQATQILHAKLDPTMDFEPDTVLDLDDKMKEVSHKLRRMLMTQGVDINALSTQVDKFSSNVDTIIDLICGTQGIQKRILLGSERGELASSQDRQNKIDTISAMRGEYAEPTCVRQLIDRLIKYGALPKPIKGEYIVSWSQEEKLSEKEKAEAAKTRAEANVLQMKAEGKLITTSDETRDDIYGKKPLEVETETDSDSEIDSEIDPNPISVSATIDNIQRIVNRNLKSLSSEIMSHFSSVEISESDLDSVDSIDFRESDLSSIISSRILSVMLEASKPAAKVVKSRVQSRFSAINIKLDITNPRAIEFASTQSAQLIKEIIPETVSGVRTLIASAIESGISPNKISQSIRSLVGLRSDQVTAVNNLRDELRAAKPGSLVTRFPADGKNRDLPGLRIRVPKSGISDEWIESKAARYAEMQLNYRGRLIARTELSTAANEGLRETWRQSIENGYLPETIKRIWIANTDRHAEMDGQIVGIDEPFEPPIEPGSEPHCGCSQGLTEAEASSNPETSPIETPETSLPLTTVEDFTSGLESSGHSINVLGSEENLDLWNSQVGMSPSDYVNKMLGQSDYTFNGTMNINNINGSISVDMNGTIYAENFRRIGALHTEMVSGSESTLHLLELSSSERGKGFAKDLLREQFDLAKTIGSTGIDLEANMSAGAYAWSRYGFVPDQASWNTLRNEILSDISDLVPKNQLKAYKDILSDDKDPTAVWALADSKKGKDILSNRSWIGSLDFNNKTSMERFLLYIGGGS